MEEINLWTRSGEIGDVWVVGEVDISDVDAGWLIIEGIDGGSFRSDIAIDDVAITNCQVRSKPKFKEWNNKRCIPRSMYLNLHLEILIFSHVSKAISSYHGY